MISLREIRAMVRDHQPVNHIRSAVRETLVQYVSCSCLRPKLIQVRDRLTSEMREMYVPCGHCKNCYDKRVGEWASRMILHTLYSAKNCYFITLTYRSFDNLEDVPVVLRDAYYRKDSDNYLHRVCYSPCLLRQEHVQRFMKYLRKIHGDDKISFFQGSEYGSDYGRPHHHLVLWSNEPISKKQIIKAWTCRVPGKKHVIHIGRVDYNDLNDNGTVVKIDGIDFGHDAKRCFSYVAKYVAKSFVDPNNVLDSRARLNYFIYDTSHSLISSTDLDYIFNKRIRKSVDVVMDWANYFKEYVRKKDFEEIVLTEVNDPTFNHFYAKRIYYAYETTPLNYLTVQNEYRASGELSKVLLDWHPTISPVIFRKVFRPYCLSSRASGLGMDYCVDHYSEYQKGNFVLPTYNGSKLLLPHAFVRKTKELLYRFEAKNAKIIGKCTSSELLINEKYFARFFVSPDDIDWFRTLDHKVLPSYDFGISLDVNWLIRNGYSFRDNRDKTYNLVFCSPHKVIEIQKYYFDRSSRAFRYLRTLSFDDFMSELRLSYELYSAFKFKFDAMSQKSYEELTEFLVDMQLYADSIFEASSSYVDMLGESHCDTSFEVLLTDAYKTHIEQLRAQYDKNKSRKTKSNQFLL